MTLTPSAQRLSRLLILMSTLTETSRPLTAREVRDRIEGYGETDDAFRANFNRDKRELRDLGIEIDVIDLTDVHPPEQGYRIRPSNYALRDPGLEPDEAAALQLAVSMVRLDGVSQDGLWKLGAAPPVADDEPASAALPADPTLAVLFGAVADRRITTFRYRGAPRTVEPHRLQFARGRWYLAARDRDKGEERQFRLDRIDSVPEVRSPQGFAAPSADVLARVPDPWSIPESPPVVARVAVDGPHAALARVTLGEAAVVEETDEQVVFELAVTHTDGFRSFVLGFGEHAEVLEPASLRDEVVRWLADLAGGSGPDA